MQRIYTLLAPLAVLLTLGCGGSSNKSSNPVAPATRLEYTNPNAGDHEWSLVKDPLSTNTHLVLDLVGPSDDTKWRGIGFTLQADTTQVKFGKFQDDKGNLVNYYQDGGVFQDIIFLYPMPSGARKIPPVLQAGGIYQDKLMVGIYQKRDDQYFGDVDSPAKPCSGATVLQVAIDFDASLKATPGEVALNVLKVRAIPENINTEQTRKTIEVPLKVGTLTLN